MSGHSKWATIKRKKGKLDAARGRTFTKLIKEITIAARAGGGDPDGNPRLRTAIQTAKTANMPQDNIKKAIQKGTGELPGVTYEETSYEGYGPGGAAVIMEVVTDNKNRTVAEVRHTFAKYNGNLGETGCVGWMFDRRGQIIVEAGKAEEEQLMELVLEAGADDLLTSDETFEVVTTYDKFEAVKNAIETANIDYSEAQITMIPQTTIKLEGSKAESMIKLMMALEDHDDIQNVYANFDIDDDIMEKMSA
jgi:YebC/PmpR family DNA-binding regulatory protein